MEILTTYNNDTLQLISSGSYELKPFDEMYVDGYFDLKENWELWDSSIIPTYWANLGVDSKESFGKIHWDLNGQGTGRGYPVIKLSVFSDVGSYLENEDLQEDLDFYISNGQIFLKPNEYLDRTGFSENNYNLQFDFIQRFRENDEWYISEISPSRKEIRIEVDENIYEDALDDNLKNQITYFLHEGNDVYNFNSFLELSQGRLIAINGYAFDDITNNKRTLIIKLNQPLPNNVSTLSKDFRIVNKFLSTQTETIFFRDVEGLAISGFGLEIDIYYLEHDSQCHLKN